MLFCLFACGNNSTDIISQSGADASGMQTTESATKDVNTTEEITESDISETTQRVGGQPCLTVNGRPLHVSTTAADFAFRAFKEALKEETNALISPVSIITALTITANGAKGETLEEIENALGADIAELNSGFAKSETTAEEVKTANSVWLRQKIGLEVNQRFIDINQRNFGAEVFKENFNRATLDKINRWVSDNTDGMIKNMLSELPEDAVIYLINTILFDAEWKRPYSQYSSNSQTFTAENGKKQVVSMLNQRMSSSDCFTLGKTKGIVKEYSNGYAFAAMLPNEGTTVAQALESFTGEDFVSTVNSMVLNPTCGTGLYPIDVSIPKFEFDCSFNLNNILKSLGINAAFNSKNADFSAMATSSFGNIYIGNVYHNTSIKLTENGTKAGAATVIEFVEECAKPADDAEIIKFDRPFIYVIYETDSGMPLFVGTVREF